MSAAKGRRWAEIQLRLQTPKRAGLNSRRPVRYEETAAQQQGLLRPQGMHRRGNEFGLECISSLAVYPFRRIGYASSYRPIEIKVSKKVICTENSLPEKEAFPLRLSIYSDRFKKNGNDWIFELGITFEVSVPEHLDEIDKR